MPGEISFMERLEKDNKASYVLFASRDKCMDNIHLKRKINDGETQPKINMNIKKEPIALGMKSQRM